MNTLLKPLLKKIVLIIFILTFPPICNAQWSQAVNLSPGAIAAQLNESMGSCIGVSGDTVHVVYGDRFDSKHGAIYYTRSVDSGSTWSTPAAITDINDNAWNAAISVNAQKIHVAWRVIDTINNHRSSHYIHSLDGGNTWGMALTIDTAVADWPAIASSGNNVYMVNDIVTAASPYNTEIFFLKSTDDGATWSAHQQITFATGRSEDEAIIAQDSGLFMSWNDNRTGQMRIYYKHSGDCGVTWDADTVVMPPFDYGTMVYPNGQNVDVVAAGAPSGHYQIHIVQSHDTGLTWGADNDLTLDPANTYYYPDMVRDSNDLHLTYVKSGVGAQYLHSSDGGATWDTPYSFCFSGITPFIAFTGCILHVIVPDSGHINYFRNPTGNAGAHCIITTETSTPAQPDNTVKVFPNPFTSQITIEISSHEISDATLKVYNVFGSMVVNERFRNKIILDRNNLKDAVFYYKVLQKDSIIATGKILKQ
jgi:hypothetical protein